MTEGRKRRGDDKGIVTDKDTKENEGAAAEVKGTLREG